ncbi:MAG: tRNA dihydrouridine synthase DusB [Ruminococcaceae bacterium]|nr:tRNA dihydrouridine synthase DusB [Oscillospiraceae bacterium]
MGLTIGKTNLKHGLMLAPMAGVTDKTFRRICKAHGAEYTVSEMVSAKALCYEQRSKKKDNPSSQSSALAAVFCEDLPMGVQIFGHEPEFMAEAARMLASGEYNGCRSDTVPTAIDINMGCPVRKVTANGEGSALMKTPKLAAEIARAVCKAVDIPVTVKIRAGWDAQSVNALEVAKYLEDAGASMICVHARTRNQFYMPGIDLDVIARVKEALSVAVVGNGDIYTVSDAKKMLEYTGCDGIMIGRGATGNPWIFEELTADFEGREFVAPSYEERIALAKLQLKIMIAERGERAGFAEGKKHMAWYINGMRSSAAARNEIMCATTPDEVSTIFERLLAEQEE